MANKKISQLPVSTRLSASDILPMVSFGYTKQIAASALADFTDSKLKSLSSVWQSTYTSTSYNSGNWNNVYTNVLTTSSSWDSVYTSNVNTSGNWNDVYTNNVNTSGNWNSVYTNVVNNSASYARTATTDSKFFAVSGGSIIGNVVINGMLNVFGDLSSTGTQTFANTIFNTTSALSVVNQGPGNALYVGNLGTGHIASFVDLDQNVEVLHVGGANSEFPNIGIKTSEPNKTLTVNGEVSATQTIWSGEGNSDQWSSVHSTVNALSSVWDYSAEKLPLSGGSVTGILSGTIGMFTYWLSAPVIKGSFEGDAENLTGVRDVHRVPLSGGTLTGGLTGTTATFSVLSAAHLYGDASNLTGISYGAIYGNNGAHVTTLCSNFVEIRAPFVMLSGTVTNGSNFPLIYFTEPWFQFPTLGEEIIVNGVTTTVSSAGFDAESGKNYCVISNVPNIEFVVGNIIGYYPYGRIHPTALLLSNGSLSASKFYGDGSNLTGVVTTQYTPPADATFTSSVSAPAVSGVFYGDGSNLTGLPATYTPPADATFTSSVSAPAVSGVFYGDGSFLTGINSTNSSAGGLYLPLSGGTLSGPIYFNTESYEHGPRIDQGRLDTNRGGLSGISLVCSVDYDFNWQAGWITAYEQDRITPRPLYIDSEAGTSIRLWTSSFPGSGVEITHEGITFPDGSTLSAAPVASIGTTPTFDSVTTESLFAGETITVLNNHWGTEVKFYANTLNNLVNITDTYSTASHIQLTKYNSTNQNGDTIFFRVRNGSSSDVGDTTYSYNMELYPLITVVTVGDETASIFKAKCLSAVNASGYFVAVDDTGEVNSFSLYQKQSGVGENLTAVVVNGMGYFYSGTNFIKNGSLVVARNLIATVPLLSSEDDSNRIASTAWVKARNYLNAGTLQISTVNTQTYSLTSNNITSNRIAINDVAMFKKDLPSMVITFNPAQIETLKVGGGYEYISQLPDENGGNQILWFFSDASYNPYAQGIIVYTDPETETMQSLITKTVSSIDAHGVFTAEQYGTYGVKVFKKGFGGSLDTDKTFYNSSMTITDFIPYEIKSEVTNLSAIVLSVPLEDNSANIASTSWVKSQNYIGGTEPIFSGLTITNTLTAGAGYPKATITFPPFDEGQDWRNQINYQYYDLLLQGPSATYRLGWRNSAEEIDICVINDGSADTFQDFVSLTVDAINTHGVFTAEASPTDERSFYVYQKAKTTTVYTVTLNNSYYGASLWTDPNKGNVTDFLISYSVVSSPGVSFYTPPADATFTSSVSAPALSGSFNGDGSRIANVQSHNVTTAVVPFSSYFSYSIMGVQPLNLDNNGIWPDGPINRIIKINTFEGTLSAVIPHENTYSMPIGTQIVLIKDSDDANPIVVVPDIYTPGVTLISKGGFRSISSQASIATLIKLGTNEWILAGGIAQ